MQGLYSHVSSSHFWDPNMAGVMLPFLFSPPWGLDADMGWTWTILHGNELHQSVGILFCFTQLCTQRQVYYPLYGKVLPLMCGPLLMQHSCHAR